MYSKMKTQKVSIYLVGGAVRDKILCKTPKDYDYVVVGADEQWMLDKGFKKVGESFPVFLHPETNEEYALARREKKVSIGYKGFEFESGPNISLEDDLSRRDITINSIAYDIEKEIFIDPFNGIQDIKDGIIRHTSEAFSEDPLRVMRVARFIARYNFKVDSETINLCKFLVSSGELNALSADRIWGELVKLFSETFFENGIKFLLDINAISSKSIRLNKLLNEQPRYNTIGNIRDIEKMYLYLSVDIMSNKDIERFRIPSDVVRELNFIKALDDCVKSQKPQDIVNVFNKFRDYIKIDKHILSSNFITQIHGNKSNNFFLKMNLSFIKLMNLNFTDMVIKMKLNEISEFVNKTKLEVVNMVMKDI